jgi:hypothetical protein
MKTKKTKNSTVVLRAGIEVCSIIFLFYANLLMGEFTNSNSGHGKTLAFALGDIFSWTNFVIAVISALVGHVIFQHLRKQI